MIRLSALCVLAGFAWSSAALAAEPSSGTISDSQTRVSYTGGPYLVPNQAARATGEAEPVCADGTDTCDVFTLTVNVSDALRQASAASVPFVEISVGWELDNSDYDVYVYAPDGSLMTYAYTSANPELLLLTLDEMPNGDYRIVVVPWQPLAQEFTGSINLSGLASSKRSALPFAGAWSVPLLLLLALGGIVRKQQEIRKGR